MVDWQNVRESEWAHPDSLALVLHHAVPTSLISPPHFLYAKFNQSAAACVHFRLCAESVVNKLMTSNLHKPLVALKKQQTLLLLSSSNITADCTQKQMLNLMCQMVAIFVREAQIWSSIGYVFHFLHEAECRVNACAQLGSVYERSSSSRQR